MIIYVEFVPKLKPEQEKGLYTIYKLEKNLN